MLSFFFKGKQAYTRLFNIIDFPIRGGRPIYWQKYIKKKIDEVFTISDTMDK